MPDAFQSLVGGLQTFQGTYPPSKASWADLMETVTEISRTIANLTGPNCCKAYVRASLPITVNLFKERIGIDLPVKDLSILCSYTNKYPHGCRETKFPLF